jgi:tripartite-type tricarboxylate transporter receptor subunit TctC
MRAVATVSALALFPATGTAAQTWPTKPVRLIVSYAPGGGTDIAARIVARRLSEQLGQQVIVDNRPGANGTIGNELASRATADGYTLLMTVSATPSTPAFTRSCRSISREISRRCRRFPRPVSFPCR